MCTVRLFLLDQIILDLYGAPLTQMPTDQKVQVSRLSLEEDKVPWIRYL